MFCSAASTSSPPGTEKSCPIRPSVIRATICVEELLPDNHGYLASIPEIKKVELPDAVRRVASIPASRAISAAHGAVDEMHRPLWHRTYCRPRGLDRCACEAARLPRTTSFAHTYASMGRRVEAISLYERTVADFERILGPNHPAKVIAGSQGIGVAWTEDPLPIGEGPLEQGNRFLQSSRRPVAPARLLLRLDEIIAATSARGRGGDGFMLVRMATSIEPRALTRASTVIADRITRAHRSRPLAQQLPRLVELVELETGHCGPLEAPDEVAALLRRILPAAAEAV